jgi:hypothetical protein
MRLWAKRECQKIHAGEEQPTTMFKNNKGTSCTLPISNLARTGLGDSCRGGHSSWGRSRIWCSSGWGGSSSRSCRFTILLFGLRAVARNVTSFATTVTGLANGVKRSSVRRSTVPRNVALKRRGQRSGEISTTNESVLVSHMHNISWLVPGSPAQSGLARRTCSRSPDEGCCYTRRETHQKIHVQEHQRHDQRPVASRRWDKNALGTISYRNRQALDCCKLTARWPG